MESMTSGNLSEGARALVERIAAHRSVVVAFSGGVDSAVVVAAAYRALGSSAVAWTSHGAAVPESDRCAAREVATQIGIRHVEIATLELENPNYAQNGPDRCFHCKSTLYSGIRQWADDHGYETILSGTNHDDLGDYRPGLRAADEWNVVAPLAELGLGKDRVRELAREWGIGVADKPSSPCLSSRIAYGQIVTLGRLKSIEAMEHWMTERGFHDVRARLHADGLLRIELHADALLRAVEDEMRNAMLLRAQELGFRYVTLDMQGRSSGSLNRVLNLGTESRLP